ncbi:MAG: hypothetical protein ABEJ30_08505 [Halorientalis sp.]
MADDPPESGSRTDAAEPDGGTASRTDPGFDEAAMFRVVRAAVKDAMLDVIGTVLLVAIAVVVVAAGVQAAAFGVSPATTAVGVLVALFGVYLAAATLGVIPPARDWFRR